MAYSAEAGERRGRTTKAMVCPTVRYNLAMSETGVPRRAFLRGATVATAISYSRVMGANERVQVGLIGAGERGRYDTGNFVKSGKADVAAVCDIYGVNIDQAMQQWPSAKSFTDHRQLLETKTIDVAVIGVPD